MTARHVPGRTRTRLKVVAVTLAILVASACAGIPSSGPVTKVGDDKGLGESTVRYSPARPTPGASPEQIVSGYLDAMLAFPVSSRTAAAFLTPTAAGSWSSASGVTVYSNPDVLGPGASDDGLNNPRSDLRSPVAVRLGFVETARLDRQGHYDPRGSRSAVTYRLERVGGEWRIANPQAGVLISQKFFADYFRSFDLFFFDRPGRRILADPVYLVVGDQLATALMTSLGGGPRPADRAAARTFMPPLRSLRPSVPVSGDGVADVEFTTDFGELRDSARNHLSAQIAWTLRQVPGISAIQVVGGTTPLTANDSEVQSISSWGGYGPSLARGNAYAIADDKVIEVDDGVSRPLSGSWGKDARGARFIAVSDAGVAGVLAGRDRVRVTNRKGTDAREVSGDGLLPPWWDTDGALWLVDRPDDRTRVRVVDGTKTQVLDADGLAGVDVDSFAISPDDTRYVATSAERGGRIYVGTVLRDARDRLLGLGRPNRVRTTARHPRSASWSSVTELGFLGDSEAGRQVYGALVDGSLTSGGTSGSQSILPDVGAATLAIGIGDSPDLYVTDADGRLWFRPPDGAWRKVRTPSLTGLTFGR